MHTFDIASIKVQNEFWFAQGQSYCCKRAEISTRSKSNNEYLFGNILLKYLILNNTENYIIDLNI